MKMANLFKTVMVSAVFSLASNVAYAAPSSILFILDSSGSMAGRVDGVTKMATAKLSLAKLLSDLPEDTKAGLMVYGHREKKSCTDVEVAIPLGLANPEKLDDVLQRIAPNGKTPITYSLEQSVGAFAGLNDGNNNIVLISDGIETCDGDPCKTAEELANSNVNVRVHVVGFDISDKDREQLECIARVGNGEYFAASSTQAFTTAVTEAIKVAQVEIAAPAEPPNPEYKEVFRDDFDGDVLAEHWEVINPDPDAYIVEDGFLGILSTKDAALRNLDDKMENKFRLTNSLPKGDWRITMRMKPGVSTFREAYSLALYTDEKNFLSVEAFPSVNSQHGFIFMNVIANKVSKGTGTGYGQQLISSDKIFGHRTLPVDSKPYHEWSEKNINAIQFRIRKSGRSYFTSAMVEGDATTGGGEKPKWVELEKLTSLRSPGKSVLFTVGQTKITNGFDHIHGGETFANVDWVKIETKE